jgi:hypothetical protein
MTLLSGQRMQVVEKVQEKHCVKQQPQLEKDHEILKMATLATKT